jgi:alpha-1,6-mannosyltransferase
MRLGSPTSTFSRFSHRTAGRPLPDVVGSGVPLVPAAGPAATRLPLRVVAGHHFSVLRPHPLSSAADRLPPAPTGRSGPLTLTITRYGGLAGALLLALAGARTGQHSVAQPAWLAGTVLLAGAWLVLGRRLSGVRLSWLLVTGALWALPLLLSLPLESRDVYSYACQGSLVVHGMNPYTHGVASLPCPWLSTVPRIWQQSASPYGPLWLVVAGATALSPSLVLTVGLLRVVALAGIALAGWAGHRLARVLGADPVRAAWLGLLSPLVLVHGLSGTHNDTLLAGVVMVALLAAVAPPVWLPPPARPLLVGGLLGLAVAVKATALIAVPFVALLLAADRRWWSLIRTAAVTAGGTAAGYGLVWALTGYGLGWLPAYTTATRSVMEWTSIPTGLGMGTGKALGKLGHPGHYFQMVGLFRAAGLVALAAILAGIWFWARRAARPGQIVVATGAALLVTVPMLPVGYPWYALTAEAVLAYSIVDDRVRYRLGLLAAAAMLLILPDGQGIAGKIREPGYVLDGLIVLGAIAWGLWRLRSHLHNRRHDLVGVSGS